MTRRIAILNFVLGLATVWRLLHSFSATILTSSYLPWSATAFLPIQKRGRQSKILPAASILSRKLSSSLNAAQFPVIVVGKIIVDEYGPPDSASPPSTLTVGGGGPQAAMGAALALAAVKYQQEGKQLLSSSVPPPQPVILVGAVGGLDFGPDEEQELQTTLHGALQEPPLLIQGNDCITPRIRLWHEGDNQILKWYAVNDSFGDERGAGRLWKLVPSKADLQDTIEKCIEAVSQKPILHIICEGGISAPGKNGDSVPLLDPTLRRSISCLGVEPILFPQDDTGHVSHDDAMHCIGLLQKILVGENDHRQASSPTIPLIVSPDKAAYQTMQESGCLPLTATTSSNSNIYVDSWAVREGPQGSTIINNEVAALSFPAATLLELVNPTGAGNAYSSAYTTLRGCGYDITTSASTATGVGAVFCEYNHCPPYTYAVVQRILEAQTEVLAKLPEGVGKEESRLKKSLGPF
ncbi:hypothetical protein IV203_010684 [Nitzschia inconspicua]|uniref:Uncharacterized protein n=1 Tax=Nitzschia inconspicua TaxID=303405 RepID=A0A9K3KXU4_9STRA|nr:hypothetical protein IV203_010684 [Nitzschia inconspicua]